MNKTPNYLPLGLGIASCIVVAVIAIAVVPQFDEVFANFGAPLPWATRIVLATFRW